MQKILYIVVAAIFAFSNIAHAANKNEASSPNSGSSKKIVKWVDSKGVTHYGDKLPAQEAGRSNAEMNTQGIVLKRNNVADKKNETLDQHKLEQERKDSILLASYTKAEEIDLARDRSMQMDQAALQALTQQKENVDARIIRNNKTAENIRARNKPLPPYLSDEIKQSQAESARIDNQIVQRKLNIEATRKHFTQEKARFIALKQPASADSGTVSLDAILTANPTAAGTVTPTQPIKQYAN
jgi:hypothetical protein